jgi:hypothetical protein
LIDRVIDYKFELRRTVVRERANLCLLLRRLERADDARGLLLAGHGEDRRQD